MRDRIYAYLVECIVEPDNGQFYAHCPGLGGVHAGGKTVEEAFAEAYEAALAILEARLKRGDLPQEGPQLIALRQPPILPLEVPKAKRQYDKGKTGACTRELLLPVLS